MAKGLSAKEREKLVSKACGYTERECRRRGVSCWNAAGTDYTATAQNIFNQAYDYYEEEFLVNRRSS